jgi:hypothetical protein
MRAHRRTLTVRSTTARGGICLQTAEARRRKAEFLWPNSNTALQGRYAPPAAIVKRLTGAARRFRECGL